MRPQTFITPDGRRISGSPFTMSSGVVWGPAVSLRNPGSEPWIDPPEPMPLARSMDEILAEARASHAPAPPPMQGPPTASQILAAAEALADEYDCSMSDAYGMLEDGRDETASVSRPAALSSSKRAPSAQQILYVVDRLCESNDCSVSEALGMLEDLDGAA